MVDEVGDLEIALVTGRDQLGEADTCRLRARQQRSEDAAALRHQCDVALYDLVGDQRVARRQARCAR